MYQNYMASPYMGYQTPTYTNPYQSRLDAMQQPQQTAYQITRVNGKNGADAFQMPPNSAILLLDETAPIIWLKQTDGAGYPTCTPYQIAPYQAQPEPDFNSFNERLTRLEEKFNEQSHVADVKPSKRSKTAAADGE